MRLQLKPATATTCTYVENNRPCKEPAVGELRAHYYQDQNNGQGWPMCARHVKPEMHPKDLHGKLFHWTIVRGA